jgi:hypothetical protein
MGLGHHGRAAFLTADRNLYVGIVQPIEHRQVAFARYAKYMIDALREQLRDKYVPAQAG